MCTKTDCVGKPEDETVQGLDRIWCPYDTMLKPTLQSMREADYLGERRTAVSNSHAEGLIERQYIVKSDISVGILFAPIRVDMQQILAHSIYQQIVR